MAGALLLSTITETLQGQKHQTEVELGFADGKMRAWLYEQELVEAEEQTEAGFTLSVRWTPEQEAAFERL